MMGTSDEYLQLVRSTHACQQPRDNLFVLCRGEAARGVDENAARFEQSKGVEHHALLQLRGRVLDGRIEFFPAHFVEQKHVSN